MIIVTRTYLLKGTISVQNMAATNLDADSRNKKAIFKNGANAKDIDVVMPMYILTACSDNYSKTSGILWQYYRDEPALNDAGLIADFPNDNYSGLRKFKQKITSQT